MEGTRKDNSSEQTWGLYFAGAWNVKALIGDLSSRFQMNETGNLVVFSGGSAGGVGVFANLDDVARSIPDATGFL